MSGCAEPGSCHTEPTTGSGTLGPVALTRRKVTGRSLVAIFSEIGFGRRRIGAKYLSTRRLSSAGEKLPETIRVAVSGP